MKILQIAYYYPPMGGAGVQRALKFSKYLPEFGIEPIVLAGLDESYVQDASLLVELPAGLSVVRVADRSLLRRWLSNQARRVAGAAAAFEAATPQSGTNRREKRPGHRVRDGILRALATLRFPDDKAGWARRAESEAMRLIASESIELVFSSSPPASAHALAARIAKAAGLPWVADFRDLWTDNPGYDLPAWRRAHDRRSEDRWLADAAGVVTVTSSWRGMLNERAGATHRVACIPNGYDEADFAALSAAADTDRADRTFRIVHTGTFYGPRDPSGLLAGVAEYLRRDRDGKRSLRIRLVGSMGARFDTALSRFDVLHPEVIERVPYLPHRDALSELMAADALLLVVGGAPGRATSGWLPGKIFEYLRAAKPILLLGDEVGDCANLVRAHSRGWIADEADPHKIANALSEMVSGRVPPMPATSNVTVFERRRLAAELAAFLRQCGDNDAHAQA